MCVCEKLKNGVTKFMKSLLFKITLDNTMKRQSSLCVVRERGGGHSGKNLVILCIS